MGCRIGSATNLVLAVAVSLAISALRSGSARPRSHEHRSAGPLGVTTPKCAASIRSKVTKCAPRLLLPHRPSIPSLRHRPFTDAPRHADDGPNAQAGRAGDAIQRALPRGSSASQSQRAVQLLLGHTKVESKVRYLAIEVDDAIAIAEQIDVRTRGPSGHALPTPDRAFSANSRHEPRSGCRTRWRFKKLNRRTGPIQDTELAMVSRRAHHQRQRSAGMLLLFAQRA
jgi:hypothetical protein